MAHTITLPLPKGWNIEQELILEEGEEVVSYYATPTEDSDPESEGASIELYVGNTPPDSDAKIECINSYLEAIGAEEDEEVPVSEIPFLGQTGWYYDAQDDEGAPVILICVEVAPGTLVMAILAHRDEESLDELMSYVDENLKID
jgi:hypothetical protein